MKKHSRNTIRAAVTVLFTLITLSPLAAVTPEEFEAVVNIDASIADLARLVNERPLEDLDTDRYYILEGSVASTQILDPNPASFLALITLAESTWVNLDRIEMYEIYIVITDPSFAERLPERLPRDPAPDVILPNQQLLVIGPMVDAIPDLTSTEQLAPLVPVIQAIVIR